MDDRRLLFRLSPPDTPNFSQQAPMLGLDRLQSLEMPGSTDLSRTKAIH